MPGPKCKYVLSCSDMPTDTSLHSVASGKPKSKSVPKASTGKIVECTIKEDDDLVEIHTTEPKSIRRARMEESRIDNEEWNVLDDADFEDI
jgi:hypothetical protein